MRSGLEVAATTNMPCESPSTPSNCVNNWLTTRSVTPVLSWPRLKKQFYKKKSKYTGHKNILKVFYVKVCSYIRIGGRKNLLRGLSMRRKWSMGSSNYVLSILPWSQAVKFVKEHNARFCKSSFFESFSYGRFTFSNKLWEQFGSLFDRKIIGVLIITFGEKIK